MVLPLLDLLDRAPGVGQVLANARLIDLGRIPLDRDRALAARELEYASPLLDLVRQRLVFLDRR
jgi:hypothetical protein